MADINAVHVNAAGEINAIAEKAAPVNGDWVILEDSAAGNVKKKAQVGNLPAAGGADANAIHDNVAGEIAAVAEKAVPVAADLLIIEDSADANNKKSVQIGNLPGGGGGLGYTLFGQSAPYNPADSVTEYFGNLNKADTMKTRVGRIYVPKAGTIKAVEIYSYAATAGTAEDWPISIRLNDTTDTLIATVGVANSERRWSNVALAIAVAVGDFLQFKSVNPAWATNPASVFHAAMIYCE